LDFASAFLDLGFAVADQVTQLPQRPGRHEAAADHAVLDQLAAPLGVLNIALAPGNVTQMTGIEQLALECARERLSHRRPIRRRERGSSRTLRFHGYRLQAAAGGTDPGS